MTPVSLVVPVEDVELFKSFAAQRRQNRSKSAHQDDASTQWMALQERLTPGPAGPSNMHSDLSHRTEPTQAEVLVDLIFKRIKDLGWPVGLPLGSESELMKSYRVSRAVLRQAVRLLERDSIARVQRGAGGGLVVARPDLHATTQAIKAYLEFAEIGSAEILATRRILELATIDMVVAQLDAVGERRLREQRCWRDRL